MNGGAADGDLSQRKAARNLTPAELTALRAGYRRMMDISDNRGYAYFAGLHGTPGYFCWHHQRNARSQLNARLFLPWHRAYLFRFELALKDIDARVTVPWWDWSSEPSAREGVPAAFAQAEAEGAENPLHAAEIDLPRANPPIQRKTRRFPGQGVAGRLPGKDWVERLLELTDFNDFSDTLQDAHDFIHGWTGGRGMQDGEPVSGDMATVAVAAFDPIFWSHHAMVDRLWWLWQQRHGTSTMPERLKDVILEPFNLTVKDVLNINDLGYEYAGTAVVIEDRG